MRALERVLKVAEGGVDVVLVVVAVERLRLGALQVDLQLQRAEHEHLLFGAVDLLVEQLPLGLLVDLVDAHRVVLGVQVVERVELVAQQQRAELAHALLHDRQRRIQPPAVQPHTHNQLDIHQLIIGFLQQPLYY